MVRDAMTQMLRRLASAAAARVRVGGGSCSTIDVVEPSTGTIRFGGASAADEKAVLAILGEADLPVATTADPPGSAV